ncbi:MAG: sulfatase-like hydrolase/transferase, partial [Pseudomonadota bacterium]
NRHNLLWEVFAYRCPDSWTVENTRHTVEPIHIPGGIGWVRALLRSPLAGYDATAELAEMIGPGETDYIRFDRRVTEEACHWLSNAPDTPWCTFVSYLSPHYPLIVPQEFYALYDPEAFESSAEGCPDHPILHEIVGFFDHDPYFTPHTRGIARAAYFGLCSFLDAQVGQVLKALDKSGQADDTLVIFTSDHGEMLGEKGFWTKSTMYESAACIPLIAAGPGTDACVIRDDPVSLIDLAPTICDALGVSSDGFSGEHLLTPPSEDRTVLSEYHDGGCSVGITMARWGHWKYVHFAQGHAPQLFDLSADPAETQDLATSHPEIATEGRDRLHAIFDPEDADRRAHADQAALVEALGGREKLLAMEQWNFTPADSR